MRILYLSESVLASDTADSVHVVRMAAALARRGHEVVLWGWRGALDDDSLRQHYGIDESRLRVVRTAVASEGARAAARRGLGAVGRVRWLLARVRSERRAVRAVLRAVEPDLVYSRSLLALLWVDPRTPTVLESHAPATDRLRAALERRIGRRPGMRRLVLISEALRGCYAPVPPGPVDVLVAHDAADDPAGADGLVRRSVRGADVGLRVGHVGHLYPGRGGEVLLAVAERLPDVAFDLVGGTPADIARLRSAGAPPNVTFHGHVPPSTLAQHYTGFDVLVAPYQRSVAVHGGTGDTSRWMSPMKLFEYLSWGRPMVFSDLPVLHEVLRDGENALLVPPDDVTAWVDAIVRLRDDAALAERLGARARADFLARHTWDQRAAVVLAGLE